MCMFCRRGLIGLAAGAIAAPPAVAHLVARLPMDGLLCLTSSEEPAPEIRIHGAPTDAAARRTVAIGEHEFALVQRLPQPGLTEAIGEALVAILNRFEFGAARVPAVYFFDDSRGRNAYAWGGTIRPGTSGTILLGQGMMAAMLQIGGAAVRAVLAHEAAHLYQFHHDLDPARGAPPGRQRRFELQADFAAGWELGRWLGASSAALQAAQTAGRAMIQIGTPVGTTHGSSNERFRAFVEGFFAATAGEVADPVTAFRRADLLARTMVP